MNIPKTNMFFLILIIFLISCMEEKTSFKSYISSENDSFIITSDESAIPDPQDIPPTEWGFEEMQQSYASNNRYYEWYIDQKNTGTYNYENCGPASTVMASKWSDSSFTKTAGGARKRFRSNGGWWYTSDIDTYLTEESIPHAIVELHENTIQDTIDNGRIMILCLNMSILRKNNTDKNRIDRFYDNVTGHFIVIKGYREFENEIFLESYDPNSWGKQYGDEAPKGRNRYYRLSEILRSAAAWWNYGFIIAEKRDTNIKMRGLTFSEIPDASGGTATQLQ